MLHGCVRYVCCYVKKKALCNIFGYGCYFVVEYYGIVECGGGALLDRPCMVFQRVCCFCDPSVNIDSPPIWFVCVCVCRKLPPHLRVLYVFAFLMF